MCIVEDCLFGKCSIKLGGRARIDVRNIKPKDKQEKDHSSIHRSTSFVFIDYSMH